jgi:hypothetical protein
LVILKGDQVAKAEESAMLLPWLFEAKDDGGMQLQGKENPAFLAVEDTR